MGEIAYQKTVNLLYIGKLNPRHISSNSLEKHDELLILLSSSIDY